MSMGFNCTIMELKFFLCCILFSVSCVLIVPLWNWNIDYALLESKDIHVLIVPLWNWNYSITLFVIYKDYSFNCTIMELKWKERYRLCYQYSSFNCTIMELKFDCLHILNRLRFVLIVPLWNWNQLATLENIAKCLF